MILAIDVGNTHIVLGCVDEKEIRNVVRMHTDREATGMEYAIRLSQMLEISHIDGKSLEAVVIASVVPVVTQSLSEAARLITGKEPMVIAPGIKTGINVRIDDPGTLAADLLVGGVAASTLYGAPVIIVDMGTATTITLVDGKNAFRGGAIIPGVMLSLNALSSGASLLPAISVTAPQKVIGTNTVDCMRSGTVYANASMVDGMIDRMEEELGSKCRVVATGGMARMIIPLCRHEIIFDDDLMLKGLWLLYQKNK